MRHFKLVILGAGTAGLAARNEALRYTDSVLLINQGPYGTTCARVGCMPSKALLAVSHGFAKRQFLAQAGIQHSHVLQADIPAVMRHVRHLRDQFTQGSIDASKPGPNSIAGSPRFIDAHTLEINGETISMDATIIATGTHPVVPRAWQALGDKVVSSDQVFELENPGKRVAVIGLGAIGAELGQGFAQLGLEVHAFSHSQKVAGLSNPEVNQALIDSLRQDMHLYLGEEVSLSQSAHGIEVTAGKHKVEVDRVLAAVGRQPNVKHMGLELLDIRLDDKGVPIFDPETLQIDNLPIYIAGDVNGVNPLQHEATDEGRMAAWYALNPEGHRYTRRTPLAMVFSNPNAAMVGMAFKDLPEGQFVTGSYDFSRQGRAIMEGTAQGLLHLYVNKHNGQLLGSEMAIPEGEHIAHLLAWAIQQKLSVNDMPEMPIYHPVLEEGLRSALYSANKQLGKRLPGPNLPLSK